MLFSDTDFPFGRLKRAFSLAIGLLLLLIIENPVHAQGQYDIIAEKNLFHPARTEFKEKKQQKKQQGTLAKPRFWPILKGTIITEEKSKAIIKAYETYESFKVKTKRTRSRRKKSRRKGKWRQGVYSVGDTIGKFELKRIEEEYIVLVFNNEKIRRYVSETK